MFQNYKKLMFYTMISLIIGILVGAIQAVFGIVLLEITGFSQEHIWKLLPFLPIAGVGIMILYRELSKESLKGMTLVFETGLGDSEKIPKMLVPLVMFSTWITHLFGGSAGREGVAVQVGATVAHTIGRKFKLSGNSRILLVTGMAAGFAGLFQTPVAAVFFALEVMVAGSIMYEALLPATVAAFSASYTSHILGLEKFQVNLGEIPALHGVGWVKLVVLGIIFGLVGGIFARTLSLFRKKAGEWIPNPLKRIFILGCILSILLFLCGSGRYSGLGTNLIQDAFQGNKIYGFDWIAKMFFTVLTLGAGYQGGEVTPLFAMGTTLGVVVGTILGISPVLCGCLGYIAVFGSGTNTFLAPIFIGVEIFGPQFIIYYVLVCGIAYVFNGNQSIYGSQKKYSYLSQIGIEKDMMEP